MPLSRHTPFKPTSSSSQRLIHVGKLFGALSRSADLTLYVSDVIFFNMLYDPMSPQTQQALMQWRREFDYITSIYPRVISDYSIYQAMLRIDELEGSQFSPMDAAVISERVIGHPVHRVVVRQNWVTNPLAVMVIRRLWQIPSTERRLIEIREDREGLFTLKELDNSLVMGMIRAQTDLMRTGGMGDISIGGNQILWQALSVWTPDIEALMAI